MSVRPPCQDRRFTFQAQAIIILYQTMFGIGIPELVIIIIVALLVVGPSKLPDLARSMGKALGEFRRLADDVKETIEQEMAKEPEKEEETQKEAQKDEQKEDTEGRRTDGANGANNG